MTSHGAGDRWLAGELPPGVRFALNDTVEVVAGAHAGAAGAVVLLLGLAPEPLYLVALGAAGRTARIRQSELRAAH